MRDKKVAFEQKCRQELKNAEKHTKKYRRTVQIRIEKGLHERVRREARLNNTTMSKILDKLCGASLPILKGKN
ncbi:hypothetical protein CL644_01900 [bacterium]|nr:hypothetical protein [bacterium]|tara:strand:- start:2804 stop:3022 length:219 start_codon:yes stop_codon:yes gene_type:complete